MPFSFTVSAVIPVGAREIYDAWLNGKTHARMTGTKAAKASTVVGGAHEAWSGYSFGRNLKLVPGRRIVQSWRTVEFAPEDADSEIDIRLAASPRGTRLTLVHSNVPDGHTGYRRGWIDYYFVPMKAFFAERAKSRTAAKPRAKAKVKAKVKAKARQGRKPSGAGRKAVRQ